MFIQAIVIEVEWGVCLYWISIHGRESLSIRRPSTCSDRVTR